MTQHFCPAVVIQYFFFLPKSVFVYFYERTSPRIQSAPHPVLILGWDHTQDDVFSHVCVCVRLCLAPELQQQRSQHMSCSQQVQSVHLLFTLLVLSHLSFATFGPDWRQKHLNEIKNYTWLYFSAVSNPFRSTLFALVPISWWVGEMNRNANTAQVTWDQSRRHSLARCVLELVSWTDLQSFRISVGENSNKAPGRKTKRKKEGREGGAADNKPVFASQRNLTCTGLVQKCTVIPALGSDWDHVPFTNQTLHSLCDWLLICLVRFRCTPECSCRIHTCPNESHLCVCVCVGEL